MRRTSKPNKFQGTIWSQIDELFDARDWVALKILFFEQFEIVSGENSFFPRLCLKFVEFCQQSEIELEGDLLGLLAERLFPALLEQHPNTIACMSVGNFLGFYYLQRGNYGEAKYILKPIYKRMNDIPDHPIKAALSLNLSDVYKNLENNDKARQALFRSLEAIGDSNIIKMWLEAINTYQRFALIYREEEKENRFCIYDGLYRRLLNQFSQRHFPESTVFSFNQIIDISEFPEFSTREMGRVGELNDRDIQELSYEDESIENLIDSRMRTMTQFGGGKHEILLNEEIVTAIEQCRLEPDPEELLSKMMFGFVMSHEFETLSIAELIERYDRVSDETIRESMLSGLREKLESEEIPGLFELLTWRYRILETDSDEVLNLVLEILDEIIEVDDLFNWIETFYNADFSSEPEKMLIVGYLKERYHERVFDHIYQMAPNEVDSRPFHLGLLDEYDLEFIFDDIEEGYWQEYLEILNEAGVLGLFDEPRVVYSDGRFTDRIAGVYFRPLPLRESKPEWRSSEGYRARLFLGEGDFSFSRAFLEKHPELASSIVSTELRSQRALERDYPETFSEHREYLEAHETRMLYEVDGTRLHEHEAFRNRRVSRIHFNFPHDGRSIKARTLPRILRRFFQSASNVQGQEDRIHMALPQPPRRGRSNRYFYQGYVYAIYEAAARAGYILIKKRKFQSGEEKRYSKFFHRQTNRAESASIADESREYVFEKTELSYREIKRQYPSKFYRAYGLKTVCLPEMATDSESSEYEGGISEVPKIDITPVVNPDFEDGGSETSSSDYEGLPRIPESLMDGIMATSLLFNPDFEGEFPEDALLEHVLYNDGKIPGFSGMPKIRPKDLAVPLSRKGVTAYTNGQYEEAFEFFYRALRIITEAFGVGNKEFVALAFNIGSCYLKLDRYEDAIHWLKKECLQYRRMYCEEDDPVLVKTENRLAKARECLYRQQEEDSSDTVVNTWSHFFAREITRSSIQSAIVKRSSLNL